MKRLLRFIIPYLKRGLIFVEQKIAASKTLTDTNINSLAPKILTDQKELQKIEPYLSSLKNALDTDSVNNIAITGSYGSGKSTILKTFQYQHSEYEYLNISLASFEDNKEDKENFERKLEVSILQQMFYHVKPSKIPDSRFKRIVNLTWQRLFFETCFFLIWLSCVIILFKFDYIEKLNPKGWASSFPFDWGAFLLIVTFLFGVGLYVKSIIRLFSNSKISKFSIKGEVELNEANDKSVFNQHLEEILYFFERTDFNVVIIEDVDRFGSTDIFTKLREINILVNNSNLIKRKISFVYAIKDEMFKVNTERVKFFELIIPVIPFINPSNASDQLTKMITGAGLENILPADFTDDVVTFIDDIDMRLLINIFHEYQIYSTLLSQDLSQSNLFSMIVYKNMYPEDFGELPKRKGKLYRFLSRRTDYANTLKATLRETLTETESLIKGIEREAQLELNELRSVYMNYLISKLENFKNLHTTSQINNIEALEDIHFNYIVSSTDIQYYKFQFNSYSRDYSLSGPHSSKLTLNTIGKEISKIPYEQREQNLLGKKNGEIDRLKKRIEGIKEEIAEIDSFGIKEIFEKTSIDHYIEDFKESSLIRYLLLNGFINENYNDYISVFHGVNLTQDDFTFEARVKNGISLPYDHPLSKIYSVIERLQEKYFRREAIWNYSLLNELFSNPVNNNIKIIYFFETLKPANQKVFDFITGFINTEPANLQEFIRSLIKYKLNFWSYLIAESNVTTEKMKEFIRLIFECGEYENICKLNEADKLGEYVTNITGFVEFVSGFSHSQNILNFVKEKSLKLKLLDQPAKSPNKTLDFIIDAEAYEIEPENIRTVLIYSKINFEKEQFKKSNYTLLKTIAPAKLFDYLKKNINEYIRNVLIELSDNDFESEESLIEIVNRKDLAEDLKRILFEEQHYQVSNLALIPEMKNKEILLDSRAIRISWENVYDYFKATELLEFNQTLINYLSNDEVFTSLSAEKIVLETDTDDLGSKKISEALIYAENLNHDANISLLKSVPYVYNLLDYSKLSEGKIKWMIENKFVTLTVENFEALKTASIGLHIKLVAIYETQFLDEFESFTLDNDDLELLFEYSEFSLDGKLMVIQTIEDSIIINSPEIAELVCYLLPEDRSMSLRYEVFEAMFSANPSVEKRINLFNLNYERFDESQTQTLVEKFGEDYKRLFVKQNKPIFSNTPYNERLFQNLRDKKLINSYTINWDKNEIKVVANY